MTTAQQFTVLSPPRKKISNVQTNECTSHRFLYKKSNYRQPKDLQCKIRRVMWNKINFYSSS